jgi:hypothetical protein
VADTWERKTITIPGDTSATWLTDTSAGITVLFDLGSGSDFETTAGSWVASNKFSTPNQVNFVNTSAASFRVTGVQLEKGSVATPFEQRSYSEELRRCQRYFYQIRGSSGATGFPGVGTGYAITSTTANFLMPSPAEMRATPTVSYVGSLAVAAGVTGVTVTSIGLVYQPAGGSVWFSVNTGAGLTTGSGALLYISNATTNFINFDAEL